jgi:hypothetical protein
MDKLTTVAVMAAIIFSGADDNEKGAGYTPNGCVDRALQIYKAAVDTMRAPEVTPDPKAAPPVKKPYAPPVLTEYGNIGKLTESGLNSVRSDHGQNAMHV